MRFLAHACFQKFHAAVAQNEVKHKEVAELYKMLELSLNITNIQNRLQIHYCRSQIALSIEQNLIEDTYEIRNQKQSFL